MLTEFVGTGKMILDLVALASVLDDEDVIDEAEKTRVVLRELALDVHSDLGGANMLVVDEDHVVLVDFGREGCGVQVQGGFAPLEACI